MKPGDFAVGSEKSRAAARMALEQRQQGMTRFELWVGSNDDQPPSGGPWSADREDGTVTRLIGFRSGMTLVEVARAVGGYSEKELTEYSDRFPGPLKSPLYRLDR